MARRKPRRNSSFKPRLPEAGEPPSLTQLEQFSQLSLRRWLASAKALTDLHTIQFFALELERQHSRAFDHADCAQAVDPGATARRTECPFRCGMIGHAG